MLRVLATLDDVLQAPLVLFYLEECSLPEIAEILEATESAVSARIARGKAQLHERLLVGTSGAAARTQGVAGMGGTS